MSKDKKRKLGLDLSDAVDRKLLKQLRDRSGGTPDTEGEHQKAIKKLRESPAFKYFDPE